MSNTVLFALWGGLYVLCAGLGFVAAPGPALRLLMILPCYGQDRAYTPADRLRYRALLEQADLVRYTAHDYYRGCMLARDRVMAQAAHYCICYLTRSTGGTAYTVRQCALRDVPILNLAQTASERTCHDLP